MIDEEIYRLQKDYTYNTKDVKATIKAGTLIIYKYNRDTEERSITLEDGTMINVDDSILDYVKDSSEPFNDTRDSWNTKIKELNTKNDTFLGISLISFIFALIFGIIAFGANMSYNSYMNNPHYNVIDNMGNTYIDDSPIKSYVTMDNFTLKSSNGVTYTYTIIPKEELTLPTSYYIVIVSSILFICALAITISLWITTTIIDKKIAKKTRMKYLDIFNFVTSRGN